MIAKLKTLSYVGTATVVPTDAIAQLDYSTVSQRGLKSVMFHYPVTDGALYPNNSGNVYINNWDGVQYIRILQISEGDTIIFGEDGMTLILGFEDPSAANNKTILISEMR